MSDDEVENKEGQRDWQRPGPRMVNWLLAPYQKWTRVRALGCGAGAGWPGYVPCSVQGTGTRTRFTFPLVFEVSLFGVQADMALIGTCEE